MTPRPIEPIRSLEDPFEHIPEDPFRRRILGLGAAGVIGFAALSARLWHLQIRGFGTYRDRADNNRLRRIRVEPPRGVIYDRNRILLVRNRPSYTVSIVPADLPRPAEPVYRRLGRVLAMPTTQIAQLIEKRSTDAFAAVTIQSNVDERTVAVVEERHVELPGVVVTVTPQREYLDGPLTSHVLGYVGHITAEQYEERHKDPDLEYASTDRIGQMGIEAVSEHELRGRPGDKQTEVDASGREVRVLAVRSPRPGLNLTTTIDLALQREITRILAENIDQYEVASCVALDPNNGQILAMVHLPTFDNNVFSRGLRQEELDQLLNDQRNPMLNGAIAQVWAPGSVFKVVTACGGLQDGIVTPSTQLRCTGSLLVPSRFAPGGGSRFPCWFSHGPQDMVGALASSCNVYFYQVGGGDGAGEWPGLGIDRLHYWAQQFGLTEPAGIGLPNETSGMFPSQAWKKNVFKQDWFRGDTYNASIGQGFVTTTPLQMANVISTVVNGGILYRPQIVLEVTDDRGEVVRRLSPEVVRHIPVDPDHLRVVRDGLRAGMLIGRSPNGVSYTGTSWDSNLRQVAIMGKTGTAEYGSPDSNGVLPTHGWFIGAAPHDNPSIAMAVFVKRGRGAHDAARITSKIFSHYFGVSADR
jgi:penicillin-binding protein 2